MLKFWCVLLINTLELNNIVSYLYIENSKIKIFKIIHVAYDLFTTKNICFQQKCIMIYNAAHSWFFPLRKFFMYDIKYKCLTLATRSQSNALRCLLVGYSVNRKWAVPQTLRKQYRKGTSITSLYLPANSLRLLSAVL